MKRTWTRRLGRIAVSGAWLSAAPGLSAAAEGFSPATGEPVNVLPWVLCGVGLVAVIVLAVFTILENKKKNGAPTDPADAAQPKAPEAEPSADAADADDTTPE